MEIFIPYVLSALTIGVYFFVGKKYWWAWIISLIKSGLALTYWIFTAQWGFLPTSIFLIIIAVYNLRTWRKEE